MKKESLNDVVVSLLGLPYKLNGDINNPKGGVDCFGMIRIIMARLHGVMIEKASQRDYELYLDAPHMAMSLISFYIQEHMRRTLFHFVVAGDVIGKTDTVGVFTGNGNFLCAVTDDKVQILPVKNYSFDKVFTWADR